MALVERKRLEIQTRFDAERSQAERNRLGQFATPLPLALIIARFVRSLIRPDAGPIHFCDPAVGTGAFYSALRATFAKGEIASASGIEIDPALSHHANELWGSDGLRVLTGDFMRVVNSDRTLSRPNLILTNPPYVRHHHLTRTQKVALQRQVYETTGLRVSGLAGLYVYFLILASEWMQEGGLAAWLIPAEFMDVNYGGVVKRYLTELVTPIRIHRFDPLDVQFDDALVSSAVVIFQKTVPKDSDLVSLSYGGLLQSPSLTQDVCVAELRRARKWSAFPTRGKSSEYEHGEETGPKFSDFFKVQRGIATGCDDVFILHRNEARRLGLPDKFLKPILPSPRRLQPVIVESDADGYPALDPLLALLDCQLPEDVVRRQHPALWSYLAEAEKKGIRNRYLLSKHEPWYRQEHRDPAPFLCTYMGRSANGKKPFRFIWNKSRAIATNLYLLLRPVGRLAEQLRLRPALLPEVFTYLSQISADDLRDAGRVYGGGLHKMEPSELGFVSARALTARIPELDEAVAEPRLFDRARRCDSTPTKRRRDRNRARQDCHRAPNRGDG